MNSDMTKSETTGAETPRDTNATVASGRARAKPATPDSGVRLTDEAAGQIQSILKREQYPQTMYLYVGVKGGGCSGLQYTLDLRDESHAPIAETDEVFESHGITIVSDVKSFVVGNLNGTEIGYRESMMGAGFTFSNPNAKHTCGCGSSYTA